MSTTEWDVAADGAAAGGWVDTDIDATSTHAVFDGDEGGLPVAARRALVVLMKNRFISSQSHPEEWRALDEHTPMVRARLHDMFLGLRIDRDLEVAFKFQVTPDTGTRFPTLLHATEWNREETVLLVHLRTLAHKARATGETRAYVDRLDLLEHVATLRPVHATDRSRDQQRVERAVESLVSAGVLIGRKDADRFGIATAIDLIVPLGTLKHLLTWVRDQNAVALGLASDDPTTDVLAEGAPDTDLLPVAQGDGADHDTEVTL